jgi:NCAIR mutase (PurE)-related protein
MEIKIYYGHENMTNDEMKNCLKEPSIITRITKEQAKFHKYNYYNECFISDYVLQKYLYYDYDSLPELAKYKTIGVISAGKSDKLLVKQCVMYLKASSYNVKIYEDYGCNTDKYKTILKELENNVVNIVIAGMEGILYSIIADNTSRPVLFVPSNIGYGYGKDGVSSLFSAITSNSVGGIFNINNVWSACKCAMIICDIVYSSSDYSTIELDEPWNLKNQEYNYNKDFIITNLSKNGHFANMVAANNRNSLIIATYNQTDKQDNHLIQSILNNCNLNVCFVPNEPNKFVSSCYTINDKNNNANNTENKQETPLSEASEMPLSDSIMMSNDKYFSFSSVKDDRQELVNENKKLVNNLTDELEANSDVDLNSHLNNIIDSCIKYLITCTKIVLTTNQSKYIIDIARIKLMTLQNYFFNNEVKNVLDKYKQGLLAIINVLELFDVLQRNNDKRLGVYYHYLNYSYYFYKTLENTEHFLVPILFDISATKIIKMRSKKIYFCGISTETKYVDEFFQSPLEFFIHDVNHSRRMIEKHNPKNEYDNQFEKSIIDFITHKDPKETEGEEFKATRQNVKMLLFEILHEDALDFTCRDVWNAIHRDKNYTYKFEKMCEESDKVSVVPLDIVVEGAMAYTRYKLQYQFYDDGTADFIVVPKYRKAKYIALASMIICAFIMDICEQYKETFEYKYYLEKTSLSKNIPEPVHAFKLKDVDYDDSLLYENNWSNGYRRIVGEHKSEGTYNVENGRNDGEEICKPATLSEFNDIIKSLPLENVEVDGERLVRTNNL